MLHSCRVRLKLYGLGTQWCVPARWRSHSSVLRPDMVVYAVLFIHFLFWLTFVITGLVYRDTSVTYWWAQVKLEVLLESTDSVSISTYFSADLGISGVLHLPALSFVTYAAVSISVRRYYAAWWDKDDIMMRGGIHQLSGTCETHVCSSKGLQCVHWQSTARTKGTATGSITHTPIVIGVPAADMEWTS